MRSDMGRKEREGKEKEREGNKKERKYLATGCILLSLIWQKVPSYSMSSLNTVKEALLVHVLYMRMCF